MTTLIILLAVLTLILGLVEIFLFPGFGIAGIGALICAFVDTALIYQEFGWEWAMSTIVAGVILLLILLKWVARSKALDKMSLHTSLHSTNATEAQLNVKVGDTGTAMTRLALVGNAQINGNVVEVKSAGNFINPGTAIRVTEVNEAAITVEAIS